MSYNKNISFNEIVQSQINDFWATQKKIYPVDVEFIDDLFERRYQLADSDKTKQELNSNREKINKLNGTIALPSQFQDVSYVLISKKSIDESFTFCGTIVHELTHICDHYDFANYEGLKSFKGIDENADYQMFYLWTEFHARRNGYLALRERLHRIVPEEFSKEKVLRHIKKIEYSYQIEELKNQLRQNKQSIHSQLYCIMQFLGRYSDWNDMYPEEFNTRMIFSNLKFKKEQIIHLYEFLYEHKLIKEFMYKADEFERLVKDVITALPEMNLE